MRREYEPPAEWGRTITFGAVWAVLLGLSSPILLAYGFSLLARRAWRLFDLPLTLTALGLFVALARPVEAGEACGGASWYEHGHTTANGEAFNPDGMTAAHRSLPFGAIVTVTYQGRTITVRINDRGPFIGGRIIDLSRGAARALGILQRGVAPVCISWE